MTIITTTVNNKKNTDEVIFGLSFFISTTTWAVMDSSTFFSASGAMYKRLEEK